jgi:6-phosphofructokinase
VVILTKVSLKVKEALKLKKRLTLRRIRKYYIYRVPDIFLRRGVMTFGKKIAINTGGGDAPGLNAVIEAVVMSASKRNREVYGIRNGYAGLLNINEIVRLTPEMVRGISNLGGTIIGTTNKGNPFEMPVSNATGEIEIRDVSDKVVENFKRLGFDCFVAVGGDGSLKIAYDFFKKGVPVVGVPKTIDNDLGGTVITFGFDTAVSIATEAIDRLHSTAREMGTCLGD